MSELGKVSVNVRIFVRGTWYYRGRSRYACNLSIVSERGRLAVGIAMISI